MTGITFYPKDGNRLEFLGKPLKKMFALMNRYVADHKASGYSDWPYHYNERATLSMFAGAIWLTGKNNLVLEEFATDKQWPDGKYRGRRDLWFRAAGQACYAEAKQSWIHLGRARKDANRLLSVLEQETNAAQRAIADVAVPEQPDLGLGILFVTPYILKPNITVAEDNLRRHHEVLADGLQRWSESNGFHVIWARYVREELLKEDGCYEEQWANRLVPESRHVDFHSARLSLDRARALSIITEGMNPMTSRPLPKKTLKNMFLKTLWEHRPTGQFESHGSSVGGIIGTLPTLFKLANPNNDRYQQYALTKDERELALEGVEELQRDGFLKNDPSQSNPEFKALTDKGLKCVRQKLEEMKLVSVNIESLLSRENLLDRVRDDFLDSNFDTAIRSAFLLVEEAVRAKAKQAAGVTGHDLMVAAFSPGKGVLKHPAAQTPGEHQALFMLFDGANGWLRNPTAHRTTGYNDQQEVAQILGLADLLLNLIDQCT